MAIVESRVARNPVELRDSNAVGVLIHLRGGIDDSYSLGRKLSEDLEKHSDFVHIAMLSKGDYLRDAHSTVSLLAVFIGSEGQRGGLTGYVGSALWNLEMSMRGSRS